MLWRAGRGFVVRDLPISIHAIIRRVIFLDDDCWWRRWCVRLNANADAGADVRLIGEIPV